MVTINDISNVILNNEVFTLTTNDNKTLKIMLVDNYRTGKHMVMVGLFEDFDGGVCCTFNVYYPTRCPYAVLEGVNDILKGDLESATNYGFTYTDIHIFDLGLKNVAEKYYYDYINSVINPFWVKVFQKTLDEMWCSGIVSAHADKCTGHKYEWEENNIPFYHGALLYLLTYTKIMDKPKHESCEWVIENYETYKDDILAAENEFMHGLHKKSSRGMI